MSLRRPAFFFIFSIFSSKAESPVAGLIVLSPSAQFLKFSDASARYLPNGPKNFAACSPREPNAARRFAITGCISRAMSRVPSMIAPSPVCALVDDSSSSASLIAPFHSVAIPSSPLENVGSRLSIIEVTPSDRPPRRLSWTAFFISSIAGLKARKERASSWTTGRESAIASSKSSTVSAWNADLTASPTPARPIFRAAKETPAAAMRPGAISIAPTATAPMAPPSARMPPISAWPPRTPIPAIMAMRAGITAFSMTPPTRKNAPAMIRVAPIAMFPTRPKIALKPRKIAELPPIIRPAAPSPFPMTPPTRFIPLPTVPPIREKVFLNRPPIAPSLLLVVSPIPLKPFEKNLLNLENAPLILVNCSFAAFPMVRKCRPILELSSHEFHPSLIDFPTLRAASPTRWNPASIRKKSISLRKAKAR